MAAMAGALQALYDVTEIDLTTTNILLGIMAGVQVIVLLALAVAALYARRAVTQVTRTVSDMERDHVRPLRARVERILDDLARVSARVEEQSARIDASVTGSLDAAERQARRVAHAVSTVARETSAVASGVKAAVSAVGAGLRSDAGHSSGHAVPVSVVPHRPTIDPLAPAMAFEGEYEPPRGDHHESVR
jgi:hypothetical protein